MSRLILFFILFFIGCEKETGEYVKSEPAKEVIVEGLKRPWSIAFLTKNEALVTEKDGDLLRVNLGTGEKTAIRGLPADRVDSVVTKPADATSLHYPWGIEAGLKTTFNEGLLEVGLGPDFISTRRIFLSYVAEAEDGTTTKVISAVLEGDSLVDVKSLLVATPFSDGSYHYGGGMVFGPDGKLYITVGERLFSEGLQPALPIAQDVSDHRGKIYRINPDGTIPDDNPEFESVAVPGIYALGIRNAQGLAVNPSSGNIWFTEHGTNQGDELNLLQPGANYGWPLVTSGSYRFPDYKPPALDVAPESPRWFWQHTVAPTGLVFYTGDEFPEWKNDLLVSGLSRGSLWRFRIEEGLVKSAEELFIDQRVRARKVAQGPGGNLYLLTDEPAGRIIQIKNKARVY